jgi:hypothetical protein
MSVSNTTIPNPPDSTNEAPSGQLATEIVSLETLLKQPRLKLPDYQRPYKWTLRHVHQLLDDLFVHKSTPEYRLGTLVLHDDGQYLNVVDGQQRLVTFTLIFQAVFQQRLEGIQKPSLKHELDNFREAGIFDPQFRNEVSISNIWRNYLEISRKVAGFDEDLIEFVLKRCKLVKFTLNDISEAFQFFDSQNSRGKDLEPHDLLKAFHLREFLPGEEEDKREVVQTWERMGTDKLSKLFAEYLYRIRGWAKEDSARYFTKDDTSLFKGVNIHASSQYPYVDYLRIAHFYVAGYNQSNDRNIDQRKMDFPFQIDQPIINGKRFFEMVAHYKHKVDQLLLTPEVGASLDEGASKILKLINKYDGKNRVGDQFIRMMFDCALIYYIDKFGYADISKAVERIFIWSYKLRLRQYAIQLATVDNYVRFEANFFRWMKDAITPIDCLAKYIKPISSHRSTKTDDIVKKFKELKYYA